MSSAHSFPIVWTIAGSDCCAGAGLQADLHTFHDFNVIGNSIVSAVTAQHPHGVLSVTTVDEETYRRQFEALLIQGFPDAIKIGLLCNGTQIALLAETIRYIRAHSSKPVFVVYDPVATASSGQKLADVTTLLPKIKTQLLPLIDLLTPNAHELARLTMLPENAIRNEEQVIRCADLLRELGVKAILAKGGHFTFTENEICDYLIEESGVSRFYHPRIDSVNTHGTGCTLAAAIAAMSAKGFRLQDSVTVAVAYLQQGLRNSSPHGQTALASVKHSGYPVRRHDFPRTDLMDFPLTLPKQPFATTEQKLGLYPVVDSVVWIEKLIHAGVKTLQIRLKNQPHFETEEQIKRAIALARQHQVRLFINDYWQLAVKYGAYGVHLGQEDLATADLTAIQQAGLRLGVSTHGYFEMMRVFALRPSYIACGPIFPTATKVMQTLPQGVQNLMRYVTLAEGIPTVAIGGIKLMDFPAVLAAGVGSIAVVSAITQAENWQSAVEKGRIFFNRPECLPN